MKQHTNATGISPLDVVSHNTYLGAHLRTAADAEKAGWMGYSEQSLAYLLQATETGLKTIYVTSESEPAKLMKTDGKILGMHVVTKEDLLEPEELKELAAMSWDQRALVDYEVLLRAGSFGGIDTSSFSWNIALRRHFLLPTSSWKMWGSKSKAGWKTENGGVNVEDGLSRLMGQAWRFDMFREAMWP